MTLSRTFLKLIFTFSILPVTGSTAYFRPTYTCSPSSSSPRGIWDFLQFLFTEQAYINCFSVIALSSLSIFVTGCQMSLQTLWKSFCYSSAETRTQHAGKGRLVWLSALALVAILNKLHTLGVYSSNSSLTSETAYKGILQHFKNTCTDEMFSLWLINFSGTNRFQNCW